MNHRRTFVAGLLWLASGCAGSVQRGGAIGGLDREAASPVARQAQRQAPAAYAEFARALDAARAAAGGAPDVLADRIADAQMTLAWAATQARLADAVSRTQDADRRIADAEAEIGRMDAQATVLLRDAEARTAADRALVHAHASSGAPTSVVPADRAAAAADTRQQAELDLAAAVLLGATDAQQAPVRELIRAAEQSSRGSDGTAALVSAGRAFTAAEQLVRTAREGHAPPERATQGAQLVSELADAGGFDPHRDERGVIAVMRGLFARGTALAPAAAGRVQTMARVIQSHPDARVRIESYVGGADRARAERNATAQAQAVVAALVRAGVPAARVTAAGLARTERGTRIDDRIEVVLVLPTAP